MTAAATLLAGLRRGRDNARSLSELAEDTNLPRRDLEKAIRELRLAGHPICSGSEGIYFGERAADIDATLAQLDSRIRSQFATRRALRRVRRRLAGIQRGEVELMFWPEVAA